MASGLQCPSCGHVHPSGLPEIARGDATFRCYGCYRTLSVPEGWTGRSSPRPAPEPRPVGEVPPGAGTRDARAARLASRRPRRGGPETGPPTGLVPSVDAPTQMVPTTGPAADPTAGSAGAPTAGSAGAPDWSAAGSGGNPNWRADGAAGGRAGGVGGGGARWSGGVAGREAGGAGWSEGGAGQGAAVGSGAGAGVAPGRPLGWVAPRRSGEAVPTWIRVLVWAGAFGVGLLVTAFVLRKVGLLDVNTAIDLYAGSGAHRFGVLLVMLPLWALLSATIAHFSLEGLARRRRARPLADRSPAGTSTSN